MCNCVHRQIGCAEQEDVLRPYSHLNYAWDEPSLPHKLVLSLPGNRVLGTFDLDKVCVHISVLLYSSCYGRCFKFHGVALIS